MLGLRFVRGPSLVTASGGHSSSRCGDRSSSRCAGPSPSRPLPLRGTGSRRAGSALVAHGLSCSAARGIFPDQGSNPCPLHWQADSQPLRHQGSPKPLFLTFVKLISQQSHKGVLDVFLPYEDFSNIHNIFWCSMTELHINNNHNHDSSS